MLSKRYRLKERSDFRRIYQRGKSLACPYFVMYYRPSKCDVPRLGFSASKIIGNAVERNRQRRRLSELCRCNFDLFSKNRDYIFIVRNGMKYAGYLRLEEELKKMFIQNSQISQENYKENKENKEKAGAK